MTITFARVGLGKIQSTYGIGNLTSTSIVFGHIEFYSVIWKKRRPYTQLGLVYTKTGGAKNVWDKSHRHVEMCVCWGGGDLLPPHLLKKIYFIWMYIMYVRYKAYLNQTHIPLIYAMEMKLKLLKEN